MIDKNKLIPKFNISDEVYFVNEQFNENIYGIIKQINITVKSNNNIEITYDIMNKYIYRVNENKIYNI
jgi:hypothetical protein